MDVGYGCLINDKWIPEHITTNLLDINGDSIHTRDTVLVRGCTSSKAIVGKTDKGFMLFFGSENGSIGWDLNEDMIKKHKVEILK